MFDSQFCSLATITFLVHVVGLVIAVSFRLRSQSSLANLFGLLFGLIMMGSSSMLCLAFDPSCGIMQGVAVVAVAVGSTLSFGEARTSGI